MISTALLVFLYSSFSSSFVFVRLSEQGMQIHISQTTKDHLEHEPYIIEERGKIFVKVSSLSKSGYVWEDALNLRLTKGFLQKVLATAWIWQLLAEHFISLKSSRVKAT